MEYGHAQGWIHHRADHRVHQAGRAGMAVSELARQHGFSPASFYAWRAKYGGMEAEDAKRLKGLESENNRLRRLLAGAHLDIEALTVGFGVKRLPRRAYHRPSYPSIHSRTLERAG